MCATWRALSGPAKHRTSSRSSELQTAGCRGSGGQELAWQLRARAAVALVGAHLRWWILPARCSCLVRFVVVKNACESKRQRSGHGARQQQHDPRGARACAQRSSKRGGGPAARGPTESLHEPNTTPYTCWWEGGGTLSSVPRAQEAAQEARFAARAPGRGSGDRGLATLVGCITCVRNSWG